MIIYAQTSRYYNNAVMAIDSDEFKSLQDDHWPIDSDIQDDVEKFWKFKLALRMSGEKHTTSTPPERTFVISRDRTQNLFIIDKMIEDVEFSERLLRIGADKIEHEAIAFHTIVKRGDDHILHCARLSVIISDDDAEAFNYALQDLLNRFDRTANTLQTAAEDVNIDTLIKEMETT